MAPIIGVTATLKKDVDPVADRPLGHYVRSDLDYVSGVSQAGGLPVVLPPFAERAAEMARSIDGLVLSGGSDLDPRYYGEEPSPELGPTIPERDAFEMALVEEVLGLGLPVFGICRGLQVLNVALGGTLYQDLPSQLDEAMIAHRQQTPKWQWTHEVEVEDSGIAGIMGSKGLRVNSYHHQAIKDLAAPLRAVARSSADGVIEAIEYRDLSERWILGVQWHAEAMRDLREEGPEHRNLFRAHVEAAERHALRRAAA